MLKREFLWGGWTMEHEKERSKKATVLSIQRRPNARAGAAIPKDYLEILPRHLLAEVCQELNVGLGLGQPFKHALSSIV